MNMNSPKTTALVRLRTQRPRDAIAALRRIEETYLAKITRAETEYAQGVKDVAEVLVQAIASDVTPAAPEAAEQAAPIEVT